MTTTVDAVPSGAEVSPGAGAPPGSSLWAGVVRRVNIARWAQVAAVIPPVAMVLLVLASSKLQWFDYWSIFPRVTNPDGSLAPRRLFSYHEGHILAVPSVIYWLNYKVTSGLNTALGLFAVALAAAQVLMLRVLLPKAKLIGQWWVTVLFVVITALLFASQGAHNFSRAMSGTAWLLANFFAVAAILVVSRGSRWAIPVAIASGVLATLSYGTGLMTWPAVLVAVFLIYRRIGAAHVLLATASAISIGWFFLFYESPGSQSSVGVDLVDMGRRTAQVLGSALIPDPTGAMVTGVVAVVAAGFLVARAAALERRDAAPWIALVVYAVLGALMIGVARGGVVGDDIGTTSRYFSLSALCWCGLAVLAVIVRPHDVRLLGAGLVVAGLAFVGGQPTVAQMRASVPQQDELAIAMRLGVSQNYPFFWGFDRYRPLLESIGHYPFSDEFDADCGRLGESVDPGDVRVSGDGVTGHVDQFGPPYNAAEVRIRGWVDSTEGAVDCVLVVDGRNEVIGAGAYGIERSDLVAAGGTGSGNYDVGFVAVAPSGSSEYRVVVQLSEDTLVELPETLPAQPTGDATP
jgi:hypothetical protein